MAMEQLTAVHPRAYVDQVRQLCESGRRRRFDSDTVASAGSYDAALHAAGGACAMVDALVRGEAEVGVQRDAPAWPPRAAGAWRWASACSPTSAVAARHALDSLGLERVFVLDWDVHHGNGTNDIFHGSREVLFASIHQSPLYPGTGRAARHRGGRRRGLHDQPARSAGLGRGRLVRDGRARRPARRRAVQAASSSCCRRASTRTATTRSRTASSRRRRSAAWRPRCGRSRSSSACRSAGVLEGGYDLAALARLGGRHARGARATAASPSRPRPTRWPRARRRRSAATGRSRSLACLATS